MPRSVPATRQLAAVYMSAPVRRFLGMANAEADVSGAMPGMSEEAPARVAQPRAARPKLRRFKETMRFSDQIEGWN